MSIETTTSTSSPDVPGAAVRETTLIGYAPAPIPIRVASSPAGSLSLAGGTAAQMIETGLLGQPAARARLDRRNPLSRRQAINRGRHLSKRFFEEGERQQQLGWESSLLLDEPRAANRTINFESFDRIPSRWTPRIVAAGLALVVASAVFASWLGWASASRAGDLSVWSALRKPGAGWTPVVAHASPARPDPVITAPEPPVLVIRGTTPGHRLQPDSRPVPAPTIRRDLRAAPGAIRHR